MERQRARFRDFVRSFGDHWFAYMSGGPSVPAAIAALYFENDIAKVLLWVTAFGCVIISAYFVWRVERKKVIELTEEKRTKLKCSFSMGDQGCVRPNTTLAPSAVSATYYRIKVETDYAAMVPNCHGRLIWIKRGPKTILEGEPIYLPFAPATKNDALSKHIHDGAPEFLDFMMITDDNKVILTQPEFYGSSSVDWKNLFSDPGDYTFHILILSETSSVAIDLIFRWKGERATSEIICLAANT
ncbi:MAG: hypothetical protein WBE85_11340 [Methylocella sp.]